MSAQIHKLAKETVLRNVYKSYYDLPNDLKARKADVAMRAVVDTSETLAKVAELHEHGLHPKLIFFGDELYENQVQACMKELHGTGKDDSKLNKHWQNLKIINDFLLTSSPQLCIMFSKGAVYSGESVPGFICVPISDFTVGKLVEFLKTGDNLTKTQEFSSKYVAGKLKFDKAHDKISQIIPKIKIARRNGKDFDMEKFSYSILKLVSYL